MVGLVEDGHLGLRQVALALLDEVLQAAGRRDDDVDGAAQLVDLPAHGGAAVHGAHLQAERLRERRERVVHLLRELAGRHEDQRARAAGGAGAADEAGEQRQAEGEGLAGAGLAAAEDVAAGERVGQRPHLDGERRGHAALGERGDEAVGQAELGEGRDDLGGRDLGGGVERELEVALRPGRRCCRWCGATEPPRDGRPL